jgi:hypothetical protein
MSSVQERYRRMLAQNLKSQGSAMIGGAMIGGAMIGGSDGAGFAYTSEQKAKSRTKKLLNTQKNSKKLEERALNGVTVTLRKDPGVLKAEWDDYRNTVEKHPEKYGGKSEEAKAARKSIRPSLSTGQIVELKGSEYTEYYNTKILPSIKSRALSQVFVDAELDKLVEEKLASENASRHGMKPLVRLPKEEICKLKCIARSKVSSANRAFAKYKKTNPEANKGKYLTEAAAARFPSAARAARTPLTAAQKAKTAQGRAEYAKQYPPPSGSATIDQMKAYNKAKREAGRKALSTPQEGKHE